MIDDVAWLLETACNRRVPVAFVLPAGQGMHRPCGRCLYIAGYEPAPALTGDAGLLAA